MKILVAAALDPAGLDLLKDVGEVEVLSSSVCTAERLRQAIVKTEVLIAGTRTPVNREVLAAGEDLRVIGLLGVGRPALDVEAATRRGVLVLNAPESVTVSVAEHALALIFGLARKVTMADGMIKKGSWERQPLKGMELRKKVLGVIGFGSVGSLVASRAAGLEMEVIVCDPYLSTDMIERQGFRSVDLPALLASADLITLHAPLNDETRGMIGTEALARMKRGVLLVNGSTPELIDETALYDAVIKERVGGVALDLHRREPLDRHPLYLSDRVICAPALSAYTEEALSGGSVELAKSVIDYLQQAIITHAVNLPGGEKSTPGDTLWLNLGEALGQFVSQLHPSGLREVTVQRAGEDDLPALSAFTHAILAGLLRPVLGERVNRINARSLAEERGVRISEMRESMSANYRKLVTVKVITDREEGEISGTLFDDRVPRIVRIDGFDLEAVPEGDFLVIFNLDRPGVIADVGELLGRNGINIARMYNGRDPAGEKAITLLCVDAAVSGEVLNEIRSFPNILSALHVNLQGE
ncbi:MAG: phosphoglycerate dehydrogenase [Deltaproteobacteria bacterium]|nr:phosphoglycerate dehydrogenase [Deltaproteobacteria bacterium]